MIHFRKSFLEHRIIIASQRSEKSGRRIGVAAVRTENTRNCVERGGASVKELDHVKRMNMKDALKIHKGLGKAVCQRACKVVCE